MDYNHRASVARSNTMQQQKSRQQQEIDELIIPDEDIAQDISAVTSLHFTVAELRNPNPQSIQRLFESLANILMSISRETVAPAMRAAAEDQLPHGAASEVDRLYSADTRDLMGLFVMLRKLMVQCTITDFAFSDLYRPTHARLQKILSYVINFLRFREGQAKVIEAHFAQSERTKLRVQELFGEKEKLEEQLSELARGHEEVMKENERKDREMGELKPKLLELDRKKLGLIADGKRNEENKQRLLQTLTERAAYLEQVADEANKLRPYTLQKPDALETNLRELGVGLANDRITLENLERRARELTTSAETFQGSRTDVEGATKAMADLAQDIQREEAELRKAVRNRDLLSDRSATVREVEHQEMILQKQLEATAQRTQKLRADHKEREEASLGKVSVLREQQANLARERSEKGREMERLKVRIDVKEKQMQDLKEAIEKEIIAAREQYTKLESHVKLYISEMEQCIA